MQTTIFFLFALALGASAPQRTYAAERVAVGATFSNIFERDANGQWQGLGVDVLRILAARDGDTVSFKLYPWPRAQAMVERGQADILIGPYKSPERIARFSFLDHGFYRDRMVFYMRREDVLPWRGDFAALKVRRIAVVRGWHYGAQFDQARPLLNVSEVPQLENGLRMLERGRFDLLATNKRNSSGLIVSLRLGDALVALCPDISQLDGYFAFPRDAKYAALRDRYNTLFTEMIRSGELGRLGARNGVIVPLFDSTAKTSACTDKYQ